VGEVINGWMATTFLLDMFVPPPGNTVPGTVFIRKEKVRSRGESRRSRGENTKLGPTRVVKLIHNNHILLNGQNVCAFFWPSTYIQEGQF
jgi:hypothetical protein